jgi:acetyl-CoA carboxylase biotin carboxyl carrier protein
MDLNYLRRLVKVFDDSTLDDLVIEEEGSKVKLSRKPAVIGAIDTAYRTSVPVEVTPQITEAPLIASVSSKPHEVSAPKVEIPKEDFSGLIEIKSPMVGTFYGSPSPDSPAFVSVGSHISKGKTLCIIEAMKLMNQIESDFDGTIEKILVDNAKPVEFGQPLFLVKPD